MDWQDVRYFLVLAQGGSLSNAARVLRVEHTTIARRVTALEAALDLRLFDRLPRGWRLTQEGRSLLPFAENLAASATSFERRALGASRLAGTVRLSAPPVLVTHFLIQRLTKLAEEHPEVCVDLSADRREANLLRGDAEIALRIGAVEVPPGLVVRKLGSVGYGLYGTPKRVAARQGARAFVGFDDAMRGTAQKQWLETQSLGERVTFRSNDLFAHYQAARAGLGIALLPHFMLEPGDGLMLFTLGDAVFERELSLIVHPDVRRSERVTAVTRYLRQVFQSSAKQLTTPRRASLTALGDTSPSQRAPPRRR
jgi:DNA-binding transcriptional LysR family regulator